MEAASDISSPSWTELCLVAVRLVLGMPLSSSYRRIGTTKEDNYNVKLPCNIDKQTRDIALHIICCNIEGKFVPFSRRKMQKDVFLVSLTRFLGCKSEMDKRLSSANYKEKHNNVKDGFVPHFFDPTPSYYYDGALASWLELLNPTKNDSDSLDYLAGISMARTWISKLSEKSEQPLSWENGTCISRWVHIQVELGVCALSGKRPDIEWMIFMVKSVITPSLRFGCANILRAILETQLFFPERHVIDGYNLFISANWKPSAKDLLHSVAIAVGRAESEVADKFDHNGHSNDAKHLSCRCLTWSAKGVREVRGSIINVLKGDVPLPCLWKCLVRIELLCGNGYGGITGKHPERAFFSSQKALEKGLAYCAHSKELWMDAFTVLRPTFSEESLFECISTLEDMGMRLFRGIEEDNVRL